MKFSANLGLLWPEIPQIDKIYRAKEAGFDAIEFQFPYDNDATEIKKAIDDVELPVIGINTLKGNIENGDFGLNAVPSKIREAQEAINLAVEYATIIGAQNIHCMGGITELNPKSLITFIDNLKYARDLLKDSDIKLLIEPKNQIDNPGYFLTKVEQARDICELVGKDYLKIMYDFYHVQINQGDVLRKFENNIDFIGHIQIASVPKRNEPIYGELNYKIIIPEIYNLGYSGFIGAEYNPLNSTDNGLSWLKGF